MSVKTDIRLARTDDLAVVQEIVSDAYSHYVARIGRKPGPLLDDYASLIALEKVFVIAWQGNMRGILVLTPVDGALLLDNIAIAPEAQGKGLGRELLSFAERRAIEAGFSEIRLYTNAAMTENIALYERIGYVETHRAEEHGLSRVFMTKRLSP